MPKVLAWSSRPSATPVQAEFVIMEKAPGVGLDQRWEALTGRQKWEVVKQLVGFESAFASTRFARFGSLYYADDVAHASGNDVLFAQEDGTEVRSSQFAIGPTNHRMFFDDGRADADLDRGPCTAVTLPPSLTPAG